jgi:hypothetical protein
MRTRLVIIYGLAKIYVVDNAKLMMIDAVS